MLQIKVNTETTNFSDAKVSQRKLGRKKLLLTVLRHYIVPKTVESPASFRQWHWCGFVPLRPEGRKFHWSLETNLSSSSFLISTVASSSTWPSPKSGSHLHFPVGCICTVVCISVRYALRKHATLCTQYTLVAHSSYTIIIINYLVIWLWWLTESCFHFWIDLLENLLSSWIVQIDQRSTFTSNTFLSARFISSRMCLASTIVAHFSVPYFQSGEDFNKIVVMYNSRSPFP